MHREFQSGIDHQSPSQPNAASIPSADPQPATYPTGLIPIVMIPQISGQSLRRLATKQTQNNLPLASNAPALARCQTPCRHRLPWGKRGRAAPNLASHRANSSTKRSMQNLGHQARPSLVPSDNCVSKETEASSPDVSATTPS